MPHPERALYFLQKPDWIIEKDNANKKLYADGYKIFNNAYKYFK